MFDPLQIFVIVMGVVGASVASYYIGHANGYKLGVQTGVDAGFRAASRFPIGRVTDATMDPHGLSIGFKLEPDVSIEKENHGD